MTIIGRHHEKKQLEKMFCSNSAEFVAVYGRRRVGKTYLLKEFFNKKSCLFFRSSGIHKGSLKRQLEKFKEELINTFYQGKKGVQFPKLSNWHDAFSALTDAIDLFSHNQKVVVFLDEIPWMATPKSGLLEALDYYWNRHWSENKKIKLVICGSAASWIINNVLHNTGGLHNRVTLRLLIEPFTLSETKEYLSYRKIHYNYDQILNLYMCLGGIPFYLNFFEKGLSAIQNINNMCFTKKGALYDEFELLFASLFKHHESHEKIITYIANYRDGVSRSDLELYLEYKGGQLTKKLKELETAGFIATFTQQGSERGIFYKVVDEYTLFYLSWIAPHAKNRISMHIDDHYWEVLSNQPAWKSWAGYAFESVCFKHVNQIKKALSIPDGSDVFSWKYSAKDKEERGGQIDLIFDRPDKIVTLCEIKYCSAPFIIDKNYAAHIQSREKIYCDVIKTHKQIFHSFIASGGLKKNMYSEALITSVATLADLFKPRDE